MIGFLSVFSIIYNIVYHKLHGHARGLGKRTCRVEIFSVLQQKGVDKSPRRCYNETKEIYTQKGNRIMQYRIGYIGFGGMASGYHYDT
ncbi:MAG: hypothetical protein IKZ09_12655, partial [Clostridia bacterium]|nr:hypothetical protein [Clostridia bacterium]